MGQPEWKSSYDDDGDRFAGIKKVLARVFGDGENPLAWGFPFFTLAGVKIKIHILMVVYLLAQLIFTMPGNQAGAVFVVPILIAMVILVLLHEAAHTYVARRNGATVEHIMLWPLGGLESPQFDDQFDDDPEPKSELRTTLAGIALHLALIPFFALPLVLLTGSWDATIFNPFNPSTSIHTLILSSNQSTPWWLVTIWAFHVVNLIILATNLIPMYPLDAAPALRIILEKNKGNLAARHITAITGLWVATAVGLVGILFADAKMLLAIAIVAGIVCSIERRRLQFLDYAQMVPGYPKSEPATESKPDPTPAGPNQADLDQILEKISITGIDSLTRRERRTLKKATESSRNSE
jgi:Zn-dependent protease